MVVEEFRNHTEILFAPLNFDCSSFLREERVDWLPTMIDESCI